MRLDVKISVRENPWPVGGETALRRELTQDITDAVNEVLKARGAELSMLQFVRPR